MIAIQHNLMLSVDLLGFLLWRKYLMSHLILKFVLLLALPSTVLILWLSRYCISSESNNPTETGSQCDRARHLPFHGAIGQEYFPCLTGYTLSLSMYLLCKRPLQGHPESKCVITGISHSPQKWYSGITGMMLCCCQRQVGTTVYHMILWKTSREIEGLKFLPPFLQQSNIWVNRKRLPFNPKEI